MLAMVVNDDEGCMTPRAVFAFFASKLAPTVSMGNPVGASLLAMVVNDDEGCMTPRAVFAFFASKLAPTVSMGNPVGASLLAMVVNDDEGCMTPRAVFAFLRASSLLQWVYQALAGSSASSTASGRLSSA